MNFHTKPQILKHKFAKCTQEKLYKTLVKKYVNFYLIGLLDNLTFI